MNGKRAKALRREIYGEESLKQKRTYIYNIKGTRSNVSTSSRARYQQAKKG